MSINVLMPALSPTMTEGNLVKWLKKEGDFVKAGQVLCEIETDKATMEVEAVDEGILGKILIPEGSENVMVNTCIAVLLEKGEDASSLKINSPEPIMPSASVQKEENILKSVVEIEKKEDHRIFSSPLAKRIMEQNNIDPQSVEGSGPHGRIVKKDVLNRLDVKTNTNVLTHDEHVSAHEDVKVSLMRKNRCQKAQRIQKRSPSFLFNR
jgi:pyruvate dehydrogenase E2 component (dihydrolipoamide acetyltransferase)